MKKNQKKNSGGKIDIVLRELFRIKKKMDLGFESQKKAFNRLQSSVDTYAKKADIYFQEMLMLGKKVDRLEKWILQLAEKTGVHLKYS
ncbi:hypothetical protein HY504_01510 [Candidatus Wolfebacteria bacterium]|nr:hypothetical protein [Candidatus Wolfebacteria bacterium]